jgi:MFS family permease
LSAPVPSRADPPLTAASSLFASREFRALVAARATNALAISALVTVVAFQVYDITGDPLALGWLGLIEAIPALSLALYGGHVADRYDRRTIVVVTSAIVTACALALAVLSATSAATLLAILGVIFATGIGSGFERPAQTALEAQVVPRSEAARGISILNSVSLGGSIAGPALGGVAIAVVGVATTYGGIAALLAVSTVCLALIGRKPVPDRIEGEPVVQSLLGGIRYVARTPVLIGSMALDLFAVFFGGAIALLPIFAEDILHVGPVGLGVLRTAPSVGALLVMVLATRMPPGRNAGRTLLIAVAGFGVSMIVFGSSTIFAVSLLALFFAGVTDGVSMIIRNTILRVMSPERIRGRVASVNWVFIGASNELGAFESGVAARLFGTVPSVVGGGLLTLAVVATVAWLVPGLRSFDIDRAEPTDDGTPGSRERAATAAAPRGGDVAASGMPPEAADPTMAEDGALETGPGRLT